jgi:hypothetical protein
MHPFIHEELQRGRELELERHLRRSHLRAEAAAARRARVPARRRRRLAWPRLRRPRVAFGRL